MLHPKARFAGPKLFGVRLGVPGVERLYLTGTAINVSSVSGAGRATAIRICDDLGIDFDKLTA